jgi:hypothetical protein
MRASCRPEDISRNTFASEADITVITISPTGYLDAHAESLASHWLGYPAELRVLRLPARRQRQLRYITAFTTSRIALHPDGKNIVSWTRPALHPCAP